MRYNLDHIRVNNKLCLKRLCLLSKINTKTFREDFLLKIFIINI